MVCNYTFVRRSQAMTQLLYLLSIENRVLLLRSHDLLFGYSKVHTEGWGNVALSL